MLSPLEIRVTSATTIVVVVGGLWLGGGDWKIEFFRLYGVSVFMAVVLLTIWERVVWRWEIVQRLNLAPSDISGTWRGTLTSFWEDPSTGDSPPPKTVYLVVRQTASTVRATLLTDESMSHSTLASVVRGEAPRVDYFFVNEPDVRCQVRSRTHRGSASLHVVGKPAERLKGHYSTDRQSWGELHFDSQNRAFPEDHSGAEALFSLCRAQA